MVAPEREMPGRNAVHCQAPIRRASAKVRLAIGLSISAGRRARSRSGSQQDEAVDDQEARGDLRGAEQVAEEAFQDIADDDGGDGGDDDQRADVAAFLDVKWIGRPDCTATKGNPIAPEEQQQGCRGADMKHDEEGEKGQSVLVEGPVQQPGDDHRMS